MKRLLLSICTLLLASSALAQNGSRDTVYIGLRLAAASPLESLYYGFFSPLPFLGLQVGVRALDPLELRAAFDLSLGLEYASADLLYSHTLSPDERLYGGLGPDYYSDGWNGETDYGAHATVGYEYRTGSFGFFAEAQPIYGFGIAALRLRLTGGVNVHF
jgi:hypothetical protein